MVFGMTEQFTGLPAGTTPDWVPHPATLSWFAVRVRSNCERNAALHLRSRGFQEFTPSHRSERIWSDRRKEVDQLLFPGYVFCQLNPSDRFPVLSVPGVLGLAGFGKTPTPIPDHEIERIRAMVKSGLLIKPWPFLEVGQCVLIERGPLAGIEGILDDVKGQCRLIVSIHMLQRSVSAEVERNWVRPVGQCISLI
jgi:transcription antitermination factor NusG